MRWVLRAVFALLILVALAVAALPFIPADRIASIAADQFRAQTGRELQIAGGLSPRVFPVLGIKAGRVSIQNAVWADDIPMVEAQGLVVGVDPMALLSGQIRIRRLELDQPVIRLQVSADGQANWDFSATSPGDGSTQTDDAASGTASGSTGLPPISLAKGVIRDGSLIYQDLSSGTAQRVEALDLTFALPGLDQELSAEFSALAGGQAVSGTLTMQRPGDALAGGLSATTLSLSGDFGSAQVNGRLGPLKPAFDGHVTAQINDAGAAAAMGGVTGVSAPAAALPVSLDAQTTMTEDGSIYLRGMKGAAGKLALAGDIDIQPGSDRPKLVAKLVAGQIDLRPFMGDGASARSSGSGGDGGASSSSGSSAWPSDPIEVSALGLVDAEVELSAQGINTGYADLGPTRLRIANERARAVIRLDETTLYSGTISGTFVANGRGGLSASADLTARGVRLQPFLSEFAGYDRLKGAADFNVRVLGAGNSVDALMRSLGGNADIRIGQGEILGFDLAGMIRTLDTGYRGNSDKTIFERVTATFNIADGVAQNDDLAFRSPVMDVAGEGAVDIGGQRLNYTLTPTRYGGDGSRTDTALSVPVHVKGPWTSPSITPDLEAVLTNDPVGTVQAVGDAVRERLGAAADGAATDPEAIKDAIEENAGKALLNILTGGD